MTSIFNQEEFIYPLFNSIAYFVVHNLIVNATHGYHTKAIFEQAYLKEKVTRASIELFKKNLVEFLNGVNEKESEEYAKKLFTKFLYDTYYNGKNQINTKGRIDLAIYEEKKPVVIIEAKRPSSADMVTVNDLNKKATHELFNVKP